MQITDYLRQDTDCDMTYKVRSAKATGYVIGLNLARINEWHKMYPDVSLDISGNGILLETDDREQTTSFLKCFGEGGTWKKSLNDYRKDKIDYNRYDSESGLAFVCTAPPPPSCRIEEIEEHVPASTRKVRKMVCPGTEEVGVKTEDGEIVLPIAEKSDEDKYIDSLQPDAVREGAIEAP